MKNAAFFYLNRYASSRANLMHVLERKVHKLLMTGEDVPDEAQEWIENTANHCVKVGLINDRSFALTKARSMARQGRSTKRIKETLFQKGVAEKDIKAVLNELEKYEENNDWKSAGIHAKKKRLGPYRPADLPSDWDNKQVKLKREIANFARAGFSLDISLKIVKTHTVKELEKLIIDNGTND